MSKKPLAEQVLESMSSRLQDMANDNTKNFIKNNGGSGNFQQLKVKDPDNLSEIIGKVVLIPAQPDQPIIPSFAMKVRSVDRGEILGELIHDFNFLDGDDDDTLKKGAEHYAHPSSGDVIYIVKDEKKIKG